MSDENCKFTSSGSSEKMHRAKLGFELELKFAAKKSTLEELSKSPLLGFAPNFQTHLLRTTYFDTATCVLRKNGIILRVREHEGQRYVHCLKSLGQLDSYPFQRREIEVSSADPQPKIDLFEKEIVSELADILRGASLQEKFHTHVKRQTIILKRRDTEVEVALDDGYVSSGERRTPLLEIEFELKSGSASDLYDLAIQFANAYPLRLDPISKSEKGFRLCGEMDRQPVLNKEIVLGLNSTIDDMISTTVSNTFEQFVANWIALRETDNPVYTHQLRIALRRLVAGLKMFHRIVPSDQFEFVRTEAKFVASKFALMRELDVLRTAAKQCFSENQQHATNDLTFFAALDQHRAKVRDELLSFIDDPRVTLFVLEVQQFLARRAWRQSLSGEDLQKLVAPVKSSAGYLLTKLQKRALKRGIAFPNMSDREKHQLRIALKELRYNLELLSGLFGRKRKSRQYFETVSELLSALGKHNDMVCSSKLLREFPETPANKNPQMLTALTNWYANNDQAGEKKFHRLWRSFKNTEVFWK